MDEQMEMAFGDEGERVDPVSGNEVPIGSMPEEVRDDIPAQLSEGEYVVPADVVRFYGVKFFEDIRNEAKRGFAEMEANGRIGGEPVDGMEVIEPEDGLPFDISELQVEDDDQPMMMNEGGDVSNPFSPASSTGGFEIKEYVNAAGEVMYIQFMNGQPMTFIPEGYKAKATASEQVSTGTASPAQVSSAPSTTVSSTNDYTNNNENPNADNTSVFSRPKPGTDWTTASADDFANTTKNLGTGGKTAATALGILNPFAGIAAGVTSGSASRNKAYDMLDGIAYQLEAGSLSDSKKSALLKQQTELQNFLEPTSKKPGPATNLLKATGVFGGNTSMYENLSDNNNDGRVSFADTWLGDFLGADGKGFGIQSEDDEGNRLTFGSNRYRGSSTYEGDKEKAEARRKALIEAAESYKEPTGAEIAKELTRGTENIEQNKLNALASKAKSMNLKSKIDNNNPLTEAEQATYNEAVGKGLGWMF